MQFNIKDSQHREKLLCEIMYYIMEIGYKDMKKFLHIPEEYVTDGGYPLGRICAELKEAYIQNELSEDDIRFLLKIRMQITDSPQKKMEVWLDRADEAEEYYKANGTLSMPNTTLFRDGASMFQWVHHRRSYINRENSHYIK